MEKAGASGDDDDGAFAEKYAARGAWEALCCNLVPAGSRSEPVVARGIVDAVVVVVVVFALTWMWTWAWTLKLTLAAQARLMGEEEIATPLLTRDRAADEVSMIFLVEMILAGSCRGFLPSFAGGVMAGCEGVRM